jgi:hypothetical protein
MAYLNYNQQNKQQQAGGMTMPQQQQQSPSTGAPAISSPAPLPITGVQQPTQQQARQSQKGSGQFVNLRGYIQQNQPKAQEISGAIGQNIGQQAQQIGQQVQKQQQDLTSRIQENQGRIAEQQQFGQQQIEAARAGQAQLAAQDVDRFRKIATGSEFFGNTQGLDTTKIQQGLGELTRYSQNIEQQPVRNELLRSTFLKSGEYGAGQKALDDLLLATNQPAMQNLVSSTRGAVQQQRGGLTQAQQDSSSRMAALRQLADTSKQDIQTKLGEKKSDLQTTVEERAAQLTKERDSLLKGLQAGQLTRQQAEQLGLTEGQMLFGQAGSGVGMSAAQSNEYLQNIAAQLGTSVDQLISNKTGLGGIDYSGILGGIKTTGENVLTKEEDVAATELARLAGAGRDLFLNANVGGYDASKAQQFSALKSSLAEAQKNYEQTAADIASRSGRMAAAMQVASYGRGEAPAAQSYAAGNNLYGVNMSGVNAAMPAVAQKLGIDMQGVQFSRDPITGQYQFGSGANKTILTPELMASLTGTRSVEEYGNQLISNAQQQAYNETLSGIRQSFRPQTLQYVDQELAKDGGIMKSRYERFGRLRGKVTK